MEKLAKGTDYLSGTAEEEGGDEEHEPDSVQSDDEYADNLQDDVDTGKLQDDVDTMNLQNEPPVEEKKTFLTQEEGRTENGSNERNEENNENKENEGNEEKEGNEEEKELSSDPERWATRVSTNTSSHQTDDTKITDYEVVD